MPSSVAIVLPLALLACLASHGASAQQAVSEDRCTGTLCDFYYGGPPAEPQAGQPAKQAAPTPLMAPSGGILGMFRSGTTQAPAQGGSPAPARRPLVGVGGGGLAAMARGEAPERCTGTLCDLYYGGPPPEPAQAAPAGAPPTAEAVADVPDEPAPRATRRHSADPGVRYESPRCAPRAGDPWSCYR